MIEKYQDISENEKSQRENLDMKNFKEERNVAVVASVAEVSQQKLWTSEFKSFSALAKEGKNLKPLRKLFGNFILEKNTVLFPSERGVGKSFLAMQLAIKVAAGDTEFLGEEIELNGNVLYLNLELGDHSIKKRMDTLLGNNNPESKYEAYCFSPRSGFFENVESIRNFCKEYNPVLIVIDNLRTAFSKDNERNHEMSKMIKEINRLKDDFNCAFLVVHHSKKGSYNQLTHSDMQSGAGALTDLVDADFFLRKSYLNIDYRILKRMKSREAEESDSATLLRLNRETLWFEVQEKDVDESQHVLLEKSDAVKEKQRDKANALFKQGISDTNIADEIGVHKSTVGRWRKELEN
ncbi:Homeodomain-like domain-containing protein [Mucilaginibacter yixingensis]|uniref:Homeodomain-like domain-containing protein n=1 Tax=Mucilaginibacter yixingensis TaxID=1295612 RepID=A0A2T5J4A2_9SPHI|nr:AAA family ATPase [Mucilaginibacter yixingensis]PTQ91687.1 Homeodomain-like domain-containing protein [Mucilaginibacter yixingensis]